MAIKVENVNRNRQTIMVAEQPVTLAEFDAVDVLTPAVAVPAYATVVGGSFIVDTASDDSAGHDIEVGDSGVADRYSPTDISLKTVGSTSLVISGYRYPEASSVTIKVSLASGDATVFAGRLVVQYVVTGRGGYNQA